MEQNITITLKGTAQSRSIKIVRLYSNILFRFIFLLIWVGGFASIALVAAFLIMGEFSEFLGLAYIVFGIFLFYLSQRSFFYQKIRHPQTVTLSDIKVEIASGKSVNLATIFSLDLALSLASYQKNNEPLKGSVLLKAIFQSLEINFILLRLGISRASIGEFIKNYDSEDIDTVKTVLRAIDVALEIGDREVSAGALLCAFSESDPLIIKLLDTLKLKPIDLFNLAYWSSNIKMKMAAERDFLNPEHLRLSGGFGRDWAFGYTRFLRRFSQDITQAIKIQGLGLEVIGRDSEIKQIEEALLHSTNGNVVVVGDAGSGKRTTILGFAKKVIDGETATAFSHDHIFQIDTDALLSGISDPGELVAAVRQVFDEASYAGNVLILIENIDNLLVDEGAGSANVAEVLIPCLDREGTHIIATTDIDGYNRAILPNSALTERFTRVTVEEPEEPEMVRILEDTVPMIEYRTGALITYEALKEAIRSAKKYILNLPNPEKSINLLDGATTRAVSERGKTIILPKDIESYVAEKYSVPTTELGDNEKEVLLGLEAKMHESVVGQEEAIKAIANAMRRSRASMGETEKPIGSFLFLGPTGVGKTALAKALARSYFGKETEMTRFDMSEYQNREDIYRLIGAEGDASAGLLVKAVREKPFSLILFDEVEKANPDILNLFLQILDEGKLTDTAGKKVSFQNSIIIATSNAGANLIREGIEKGVPYDKVKEALTGYLVKNNLFRAELINRFTAVIAFAPLTLPEINAIAKMMIGKLASDIHESKGINLAISDDALAKLAELGYDPEMGARPMERVIEEKIENLLAEKILKGELKKGDTFTVDKELT